MQDALSNVPKLREENAALLKEVAVLCEKQNRSVQTRPTAYGGPSTENRTVTVAASSYVQVARWSTSRRRNKQTKQKEVVQTRVSSQQKKQSETPLEHGQPREHRRPLVPIKGARKVWNTYKFVTASAVSHAIHKITSIPAADLSIKRKFKSNDNKVLSWWFVVRGEETILEQLDNLWEQVYLQTKWELKPLLSYSVGVSSESLPSGNATPGATSSSSPNPDDATADATTTLTTVTSDNTSTTPTVSNQQATTGNGPAVTQLAISPLSETQSQSDQSELH